MDKCKDCLTTCPWCGSYRWEVRERGCGSVQPGSDTKPCRKAKRLKGVPCPKCAPAEALAEPVS